MSEKHHVVYDQYGGSGRCSKCDAEEYYGMSWENTCPGNPAIAAAHRAGAREALEVAMKDFGGAAKEYLGKVGPAGDVTDGLYIAIGRCVDLAARYAEPEENAEVGDE